MTHVISKPYPDHPDMGFLVDCKQMLDESPGCSLLEECIDGLKSSQDSWQDVLIGCHGDLVGIELRHPKNDQYSIILHEPYEPGRFRASSFDKRGFFGHFTRDTPLQVLAQLFKEGIVELAPGSLNSLSKTKEWRVGSEITNLIAEVNQGTLSFAEYMRRAEVLTKSLERDDT